MRRFSQKNHLVTLNEINITPLLDLAFVLLVIFIITTPLLENSLNLDLPRGGEAPKEKIREQDVKSIEVAVDGRFKMDGQWLTVPQIAAQLAEFRKRHPDMVVALRSDRKAQFGIPWELVEACQKVGISRFDIKMSPKR